MGLILTERHGNKDGILWNTLNRLERLNALTFPLSVFMEDCIARALHD